MKRLFVIGSIILLAGCNQPDVLTYQGKQQSIPAIIDQLEDILEKENPGQDIDINLVVNADVGDENK